MKELLDREMEAALLEKVVSGQKESFGPLVEAYKSPIFNLAFRLTGDVEDASDLAQETFVRAFVNIRKYDRKKRFFTWLYTIGLNIVRTHLRRKAHGRSVETQVGAETVLKGAAVDPEAGLLEDEAFRKLAGALKRLPHRQQEAVVLRFYQGLSFDEMAEITGYSISALKMTTYRALERLRTALAEEDPRM